MSELKFKVGDKVVVSNLEVDVDAIQLDLINGLQGIVVNPFTGGLRPVLVKLLRNGGQYVFCESELELVEDELTVALEITTDETKQYNPLVAQEGGNHYKDRGIQPIEYSEANNLNACQHSVVKYITRHQDKNGVEDLGKIIHFTFLEAFFKYGIEGSTDLKKRVMKMLGEDKETT